MASQTQAKWYWTTELTSGMSWKKLRMGYFDTCFCLCQGKAENQNQGIKAEVRRISFPFQQAVLQEHKWFLLALHNLKGILEANQVVTDSA